MNKPLIRGAIAVAALAVLSGCASVGSSFVAPKFEPAAASYRHASVRPADAALPSSWWTVFKDPALDALEQRALRDNPSVEASFQRLVEARAQLGLVRSDEGVKFGVGTSAGYSHSSKNTSQAIMLGRRTVEGTNFTAGASLSYELDLWGRVRRAVEAADAQALVAQTDRDGVLLMLSSQVAASYYQLRGLDTDIAILERALGTRRETEQLVTARFDNGLSNELDLSRARVERANAESDLHEARRQRQALEHGLAVLVGASPSEPLMAPQAGELPLPPSIPTSLPAQLLAQRPDLASSVAGLRALNAQVGVAESAFYPSISLTGNYGFASEKLRELSRDSSQQFSVGPLALNLPLFDGGRNKANLAAAQARYAQAVANHGGKLLTALREVEDALSDVQQRQLQAEAQAQAQVAAARAYEVARARYERGVSSYLDVTDAQRSNLASDRAAAQIRTQRLLAAVNLARSLGGGWAPDSQAERH
ncbi:efflux transporter outer membrane subunit [Pelomonas sp. V22]|uniref:efflux transporter outer membrane subunit n=1 Tax=Pelomonas sp. V22 TaxID=2822139 RepID=UPI0024A8028D|nr:efflux transporter outer membrane subunit [Pelomonas sp. V22]MDI4631878.1 efflux transporter outer membrane subunit [Pelomonas sp. V22]